MVLGVTCGSRLTQKPVCFLLYAAVLDVCVEGRKAELYFIHEVIGRHRQGKESTLTEEALLIAYFFWSGMLIYRWHYKNDGDDNM